MSDQLDVVRIFKFNRSHLLLDGDRELVIVTTMVCLILIVILQNLFSAVVGVVIWIGLIPLYRWMAKADPLMRTVYTRYVRLQRYYPAYGMRRKRKN
ncbi:conjugal transfer protein TrbD [Serratia fonticola]|uniref:conjugal transfer protein TrbD n=1 Tax=Serratia fonticola TaxID=47917 RepID=UPI0021798436|nr:conjugal transfer protein TrbD [Serratia fonticola]CAI2030417.1 conjugal transfer protein TrbD [Serratia fonticola]